MSVKDISKAKNKEDLQQAAADPAADPAAGQQEKPVFNQIEYMNQYNRTNYDRVNLTMPKGKKAIVKERAAALKKSVNEYINDLINEDLNKETDGK